MDRNIKYVREKKVAPLLNDMVLHLLATTPAEPISSLIQYLERREAHVRANGKVEDVAPQPASFVSKSEEKAAPIAAAVSVPPVAADQVAAADGSQPVKKSAPKPAAPPPPPKPEPVETKSLVEAGSTTPLEINRLDRSKPKYDEFNETLRSLFRNEFPLHNLLVNAQKSATDPNVAGALGSAIHVSEQFTSLLKDVSSNNIQIGLGVERLERNMVERDFLSLKAFELLDELERNERDARVLFRGVDINALDSLSLDVFTAARSTHEKFAALVEESQITQIKVDVGLNRGSVGPGAAMCLTWVADNISDTAAKARAALNRIEGNLPQGLIKPAVPEAFDKLPLTKQFTCLLSEFATNEWRMHDLLLAAREARVAGVSDAAGEALAQSDLMITLVGDAQHANAKYSDKLPNVLPQTLEKIHSTQEDIESRRHQLRGRTTLLQIRLGSSATPALIDQITDVESKLENDLNQVVSTNPKDSEPSKAAEEGLRVHKEIMDALNEIKVLQETIRHGAIHK